MTDSDRIVWVDVETGGLEYPCTTPLEIAIVVTDRDLAEVGVYERVLRADDDYLAIEPAAALMHAESGLLADYIKAERHPTRLHSVEVEQFLRNHDALGLPMAGSSVHFDRAVLAGGRYRAIEKLFHYRNIDVSTFGELGKVLGLPVAPRPTKAHRALADVRQSIEELRFYLDTWQVVDRSQVLGRMGVSDA